MLIEQNTPYAYCRERLYIEEGFKSNIKADPGKETVYGVSKKYWPNLPIWKYVNLYNNKKITKEELDKNILPIISVFYKDNFWNKINADKIAQVDLLMAHFLFSISVNINNKYAVKCLQRALNCLNLDKKLWNDLKIDGDAGDMTIKAIKACAGHNKLPYVAFFISCQSGCYYMSRMEENPVKELFAGGWANRIINNVKYFFK